jgi:hypothetical protein
MIYFHLKMTVGLLEPGRQSPSSHSPVCEPVSAEGSLPPTVPQAHLELINISRQLWLQLYTSPNASI